MGANLSINQLRHGYTYPTDGAVIKLDSRDGQRVAGHTLKPHVGQLLTSLNQSVK